MTNINSYIDHTILKPDTTKEMVDRVVEEAKKYQFASVCINPTWVSHVSHALKGTGIATCTVIGFPLGANTSSSKAFEAKDAISRGADELDMVINIGALKSGDLELVEHDIRAVVEASQGHLVKVIIEACLLSDEEKVTACKLAVKAGADFVKTSTGFSMGGATLSDVRLMRETVGDKVGVKAAGGTRTYQDALAFIEAGATRIGTSSGVAIMEGQVADGDY